MPKISKSPDRHTFQKEGYIKRMKEKNEEPNEGYLDFFQRLLDESDHKFDDPQSRINNMEYDLLTTDWILEKVRASDAYAQNLYAAMCNNSFIKREMWPILKEEKWSCSWRYAGGIIADMQQKGDYIDWYCSGINGVGVYAPAKDNEEFTKEQLAGIELVKKYVGEGCITDEISQDLQRLGWMIAPGGDWENFVNQG